MSRRTKLLITTIFLVLLAIPAVYLVLTWSPERPLRFRLVDLPPPLPIQDSALQYLDCEVENTSAVPIFLYVTLVESRFGPPSDLIGRLLPSDPYGRGDTGPTEIPARSTVRFQSAVPHQLGIPASWRDRVHIRHTWQSRSEHQASRVIRWVRTRLPEFMGRHVPDIRYHEDFTPLEVISTKADPAQAIGR